MDLNAILDAVDARLTFNAASHRYWLDGKPIVSVTTALRTRNKEAINRWSVRVQKEADIETAWKVVRGDAGLDSEQMENEGQFKAAFDRLSGEEYEHQKQAREAADLGSQLHSLIEDHLKSELGVPFTIMQPVTDQAREIFEKSWLPWAKDAGLRPLAVERRVVHEAANYCGTVDLLAEVEGEISVLDWKGRSSKHVESLFIEPVLQSAGYREALFAMTGERWTGHIVAVPRDGGGEVVVHKAEPKPGDSWTVEGMYLDFLACLTHHRTDALFKSKGKR